MTPIEVQSYLQSFPDWERGTAADNETYTLERMRRLLDALAHPEQSFSIVHVVGTKGKGSTAAMIASVLRAAGYRVGLFISPHLVDYRERISVNGVKIPGAALADIVSTRLAPAVARLQAEGDQTPLHFELLCGLACEHFRRDAVEVAVVEAGLGGRLDATNAVTLTALTVITTIGFDHMAVLGDTLAEIAAEKAAVVRHRGVVVSASQPPEAMAVIERTCIEREACLSVVGREWSVELVEEFPAGTTFDVHGPSAAFKGLRVPLAGAFQAANGAAAVAALAKLARQHPLITEDAIRRGLAATSWPGRVQVAGREPLVILDGAHNRESAVALAGVLCRLYPERRFELVVAVFRDKDADAVLAPLLPLASHVVVAAADHPRALPAADLAERVRALGIEPQVAPTVALAVEQSLDLAGHSGSVLVTGSLRTVGEAMMAFGIGAEVD